jgi:hypothetical protein
MSKLSDDAKSRKDAASVGKATLEHRHFAVIADILKNLHSMGDDKNRTWVADYFAHELAKTNPKFDRKRFLKAANAADRI